MARNVAANPALYGRGHRCADTAHNDLLWLIISPALADGHTRFVVSPHRGPGAVPWI